MEAEGPERNGTGVGLGTGNPDHDDQLSGDFDCFVYDSLFLAKEIKNRLVI
jgi:hypothetical protein